MDQTLKTIIPVAIIVLLLWLTLLSYILSTIASHYRKLISTSKKENLKDILEEVLAQTEKGSAQLARIQVELEKLRLDNLSHIQKVSMARFNPFSDVGGDQSFSICFLDGEGSGIVLSSLHSRVGTRIYAKAIEKGESKGFPLSEEEEKVVKLALGRPIKNQES